MNLHVLVRGEHLALPVFERKLTNPSIRIKYQGKTYFIPLLKGAGFSYTRYCSPNPRKVRYYHTKYAGSLFVRYNGQTYVVPNEKSTRPPFWIPRVVLYA